jgi:acetaldehyde dehydrogenase/alcohol dehydrogenase
VTQPAEVSALSESATAPHASPTRSSAVSVDTLVSRANEALRNLEQLDQAQVDAIVKAMTFAGVSKRLELARAAVDETKLGVFEDKVTKNLFSTEYIFHDIKDKKTVGVIEEDEQEGVVRIAEPVGVVVGITPVTNPTSTTMFKSLIALKTRNPIVFAFHPKAQHCSVMAATIMRDAAIAAGAPQNCIQWIDEPSVERTNELMRHPGVAVILATGGSGMVKAAYCSGKPALGVGPGNVPVYIHASANLNMAVNDIVLSKTFDNGLICASEQSIVVDESIADTVRAKFTEQGAYFLNPDEVKKLEAVAVDEIKGTIRPVIVGQPAADIAVMAHIDAPENVKLLIAPLSGVGPDVPLSQEKLSPILGFYVAKSPDEAIDICDRLIHHGGCGHSAGIFATDSHILQAFSKMKASRILENVPTSFGAIGDIYNRLGPSLTLGCGTYGGNSTTDNVTVNNLLNIKARSTRKVNMKWFKVPPKIYFEKGCLEYLRNVKGNRAFIVTDRTMLKLGLAQRAEAYLQQAGMETEFFSDVEPDPSTETVQRGVAAMNRFQPDVIVAFGGGSPIDAAKVMWLFYEHPKTRFDDLAMRFVDIRKRAAVFPEMGKKTIFVAVPTTAGTGSEVTAFAVITDKAKGIKYPLADYELTPDVAILDPELTYSVPASVTADTGVDTLSHAIEAYVSVMASDYTDAIAIHVVKMVFKWLPLAYSEPTNERAREKMINASCMAGMAFTNAFLGINHSLAHKMGGRFHVPHGRANAILMPDVIRYNAAPPTKNTAYPKYESHIADVKYQQLAEALDLPASTPEEGVESLCEAIASLRKQLNMPATFAEYGIDRDEFVSELDTLALNAFDDQCTGSNPRFPLVTELKEVLMRTYERS